jgi:spore coat protein CotH
MIFFRDILRYLLVLFVFWTFLINNASAQIRQVDFGLVFPQTEVAVIRITISPDSLAQLLELGQQGSEHEFQATFRFESSNLTQTIQNVGFRLRGNTSLNAAKKSFKISFNTYIEGARWQGLEKINLNGN